MSGLGAVLWCLPWLVLIAPALWSGGVVLLAIGIVLAVVATGGNETDRAAGQAALVVAVLGFVLGAALTVMVMGQGMGEIM